MNKIRYNTEREHLVMPEYGRAVHEMVQHCMSIEDREERLFCAQSIVSAMASLLQEKLSSPETQMKLWNHLAVISGFKLDIDYPVEIIPQEEYVKRTTAMSKPQRNIRHRHYGYLVEQALEVLKDMPEGEMRDALVRQTANRMKQSLFTWNPDVMSEEKVANDIERYAPGKKLTDALEGHQYAALMTVSTNILKRKNKK
ncbi:MAG: DUF4290 domain-containing protein [Bacteroidaceae bacterium]|jgi:hypothetical protein|nr:DUF4290 domain-containing protein [Bacteroidaceae bacterium]